MMTERLGNRSTRAAAALAGLRLSKFSRLSVLAIVYASILLCDSTAFGALDKCQATLEKNAQRLRVTATKAVTKCKDAIRKNQVTGAPMHAAAQTCEKALGKVLGLAESTPGPASKSGLGKYLAAIAKADAKGVCTEADLEQMGHLVSGLSAPGSRGPNCVKSGDPCSKDDDCPEGDSCPGATRFAAQWWLPWAKLGLVSLEEIFEAGDSLEAAIAATPDPVRACDPASGKNCGTYCGPPAERDPFFPESYVPRPNLCAFSPGSFQCHEHSCNLDATSGGTIQPLGLPVGLADRKLSLQFCKPPAELAKLNLFPPGVPVTTRLVVGGPGRTVQPPPVVPILGGQRVCVEVVRAQGWCDCTPGVGGGGWPYSPTTCQDHIQNNDGSGPDGCGQPLVDSPEPNCVCAAPPAPTCDSPCTACVNWTDGSFCHPGTFNGPLVTTYSGASGVGDCLIQATVTAKVLPQGVCLDPSLNPLGECTTGGPLPDAMCVALGGTSCADADGPDGISCTMDDLIAAAPFTFPLTTGTAVGMNVDAVNAEGHCSGTGMNCAHDADCPAGQTCDGEVLTTQSYSPLPGVGISCANLESSNLSGWELVGAVPTLDPVGSFVERDLVVPFRLICE